MLIYISTHFNYRTNLMFGSQIQLFNFMSNGYISLHGPIQGVGGGGARGPAAFFLGFFEIL